MKLRTPYITSLKTCHGPKTQSWSRYVGCQDLNICIYDIICGNSDTLHHISQDAVMECLSTRKLWHSISHDYNIGEILRPTSHYNNTYEFWHPTYQRVRPKMQPQSAWVHAFLDALHHTIITYENCDTLISHSSVVFQHHIFPTLCISYRHINEYRPKTQPQSAWVQPVAFGVAFNLILHSLSHWSLFNGTWQKRRKELDLRLSFEIREMTLQMQ